MFKPKRTTTTKLILDALKAQDDFLSLKQLKILTSESSTRLSAALHWLKKARAIQSMESDGQLWFYATPEEDARSITHDEVKEGIKHKKKRQRKIKKDEDRLIEEAERLNFEARLNGSSPGGDGQLFIRNTEIQE